MSTSSPRAASDLAICRTYTVIPPASPTPGSTTGFECTTSIATRRSGRCGTAATNASRTARVPLPGESRTGDSAHGTEGEQLVRDQTNLYAQGPFAASG